MIEYLTRNDVKVSIADSPVTADGKTLPAGTAVVSMYQAKRSVAYAALYEGIVTNTWISRTMPLALSITPAALIWSPV